VLGVRATGRASLEGAGRVITWCVGHLVELDEPAAYDPRWKPWRLDTLPMIRRGSGCARSPPAAISYGW